MSNAEQLLLDHLKTPIGKLAILADERGRLHALGFTGGNGGMERSLPESEPVKAKNPGGLTQALEAYFDGELDAIDGLPVVMSGTDFQNSVWRGLLKIPCGETRSYGELAKK